MSSPKEKAEALVRRLAGAGHRAVLAGGCVRDLLRGVEPEDWDVATSAGFDEIVRLFPEARPVGAAFGVALVIDGPDAFEVATFRRERGYSDGRHPDAVDPGSLEEDVRRRDFTINAMMLDPATGEVLDLVGGRADLAARLVRCVGDARARLDEDRLRLVRAVRFAARLAFEIEPETLAAVRELGPHVASVSAERLRDELLKMLTPGGACARRALELLRETRLLREILPELVPMAGTHQNVRYHPEGDVWQHTLLVLEKLPAASPALAMGALLHDVGKPVVAGAAGGGFRTHDEVGAEIAETLLRRLRFSNDRIERAVSLVREHMRLKDLPRMRPAKLARFLRRADVADHLALHKADCEASHGDLSIWEFARRKLAELPPERLRPPRLVTGRDLLAMGLAPGPRVGEVLAALEEAQLEGRISTRKEALALARALAGESEKD